MMNTPTLAIDFGLSNIKIAHAENNVAPVLHTLPSMGQVNESVLQQALATCDLALHQFAAVVVTGGQAKRLPDQIARTKLIKINEMQAAGRGGLLLSGLREALVVSAGSGTAMVAAHEHGAQHITGSAVGGGTLQGLGRLVLGTRDFWEIDALAQRGDSNQVDLTLLEATAGAIGALPADANAVNFGKLATMDDVQVANLNREDVAAGVVCLVGQVIAVIAINAARSQHLNEIVMLGHLADLPSIRRVLTTVAGYYQASIRFVPNAGYGTVLGALALGGK